jgi:hypothetical protein
MAYVLYDYADQRGNRITEWAKGKPKIQLAKLNNRLDTLARAEPDLVTGLLHPAGHPGIWKIKIQGNPKLRPMLCRGPLNNDVEFTLLAGAVETQSVLHPPVALAVERRGNVIDTRSMRCPHERLTR